MQKILLPSLTHRFLDRGANLLPLVQIGCKNSPVDIGLRTIDLELNKEMRYKLKYTCFDSVALKKFLRLKLLWFSFV